MPKLSDIYVSALDFFAVILPGAIATAFFRPHIDKILPGATIWLPAGENTQWGVFLLFSYFIGHLVFLIGSRIDPLFHKWREKYRIDVRNPGTPYGCAELIRKSLLTPVQQSAINTFQWSRSVLLLRFASGATDVIRLEADSKFFRSLVVICLVLSLFLLAESHVLVSVFLAGLSVACLLRFGERRLKSEKQAYMHIVALHGLGILAATPGVPAVSNSPANPEG
jgi:hypothetical protein